MPDLEDPRTWRSDDTVTVDITERIELDRKTGMVLRRERRSYRVLVNGEELPDGERVELLTRFGIET